MLSAAIGFCIWFGGGWLLAGPPSEPAEHVGTAARLSTPSTVEVHEAARRKESVEAHVAGRN
jgi:hypothetical protein